MELNLIPPGKSKLQLPRQLRFLMPFLLSFVLLTGLGGCSSKDANTEELTANTYLELVDWHICGLWVINSPVAWVRVRNMNPVPIHDITFEYQTYNAEGRPLDTGTFTIEGTVPAGTTKNFIELYIGLVDLYTERLSIRLLRVKQAHAKH